MDDRARISATKMTSLPVLLIEILLLIVIGEYITKWPVAQIAPCEGGRGYASGLSDGSVGRAPWRAGMAFRK
jgi:hypothetical protein